MDASSSSRDQDLPRAASMALLGLALAVAAAVTALLYLLNLAPRRVGDLVLIAGLGGIIGGSLPPLLLGEAPLVPRRAITQALSYAIGGFAVAAASFIVTSGLLMEQPGRSASTLGTTAFGGLVGFFVGRELHRRSLAGALIKADTAPVVSALGSFEDQFFGQPLLNYDGDMVAEWVAAPSSLVIGHIHVRMEARALMEARATGPASVGSDAAPPLSEKALPQRARVLVQGGRDAASVPFAVSVIGGELEVQPHTLILVAPSDRASESIRFTVRRPQRDDDGSRPGVETSTSMQDRSDWSEEQSDASVLIDVSQAGQTVQLLEFEVPSL